MKESLRAVGPPSRPLRAENQRRKSRARLNAIRIVIEGRERIADDDLVRAMLNTVIRRHKTVQWATPAARALGPKPSRGKRQIDHVIPVQILIDRLLKGNSPRAVMDLTECCYVTRREHSEALGGFRKDHGDLRKAMQTRPLKDLPELGWDRYRQAGVKWKAITPITDPEV